MQSDATHASGMRVQNLAEAPCAPSGLQAEGRGLCRAVGVAFLHQFFLWLLVMTTKIRGCFKLVWVGYDRH